MSLTAIPFLLMRGGTSRGPYFRRSDLPADRQTLSDVLVAALGAGHPLTIDGLGGGSAVTTKAAILSRAEDGWADIDFFFGQVAVDEPMVDFKPTCGNILAGVGPAAIELDLMPAVDPLTEIRIRAVNTGARVVVRVQTPGGQIRYDGDARIAGVPGTAAPIPLQFLDVVGSSTGRFLPTGHRVDEIAGVPVTCMDAAMPMVIARATDLGIDGYEPPSVLDANADLLRRIEAIRCEAGLRMGMGDVSRSVTPKVGLLAPARQGGDAAARYFMPWKTHPTLAVSGGQCLSACLLTPGTVADGILARPVGKPATVRLEHPQGFLDVIVEYDDRDGFTLISAGVVRTARKLASGHVYVPATIWSGR